MPVSRRPVGFSVGKVPPAALVRSVFPFLGRKRLEVVLKPGIGRDATVIRHGKGVLVFSTDPVTGTATHIGSHSVVVNANDIATTGAEPVWYLCTILLPPGTQEGLLREIMLEIDSTSRKLGIAVVGGHTEVTSGLRRPIIAGFMVGETGTTSVLSARGARSGDLVLFTKTAGLEGTAILASDHSQRLRQIAPATLAHARSFSQKISVVREALAIAQIRGVHAMHDPTEGGVLNGLWELAQASGLGIEAWEDKINVSPITLQICSILRLDPLKLMSSGSLLVAVHPSAVEYVAQTLRKLRVESSRVGVLTPKRSGRYVLRKGRKIPLEAVPNDELYRLA